MLTGFLRKVSERALSDEWTLAATYWNTRMVLDLGIPGDLVECGVFAGAQIAAMARACMDAGVFRTIETGSRNARHARLRRDEEGPKTSGCSAASAASAIP